ncbi:MAG: division/cell wall cluster transcriptional repressor MraZ [bacterium]
MAYLWQEVDESGTKWIKSGVFSMAEEFEPRGFFGEYEHSIDSKNRVTLPSAIRNKLREDERLILSSGFDNCLTLYPYKGWVKFLEEAGAAGPRAEARQLRRAFSSRASEVSCDSQGRLVIPRKLKKWAGINDQVTVVGNFDNVELWAPESWEEYQEDIDMEAAAQEIFDNRQ